MRDDVDEAGTTPGVEPSHVEWDRSLAFHGDIADGEVPLPPAPLRRLVLSGAVTGALAWLGSASLEQLSGHLGDMSWATDPTPLVLARQALVGLFLGALVALLLEWPRRRLLPGVSPLALVPAVAALSPWAARSLLSAGLRARHGLPGGALGGLFVQAVAGLLLLAALTALLGRRRRALGATHALRDALAPGLGAAWLVHVGHLAFLSSKELAEQSGLLGARALLVTTGAGLLGALLGVCLWTPSRRVGSKSARSRPSDDEGVHDGEAREVVGQRQAGDALGARRVGAGLRRVAACVALAALIVAGMQGPATARAADGGVRAGKQAGGPTGDVAQVARPHVLLIVLDTLRRDAVSAYGEVDDTTPALDALARRGVLFTDALSPGAWTLPAHASLFTGAAVSRHGVGYARHGLRERPGGPGTATLPTLAEAFAANGYDTAAFVCNMHVSRANGFHRGFDLFHEVWRAEQGDHDLLGPAWTRLSARVRGDWGLHGQVAATPADHGALPPPGPDKGGRALVRGVRAWLDERSRADVEGERPWFLFLNLMESHAPYGQAPTDQARRFLTLDEPGAEVRELVSDPLAHVHAAGVSPEVAEELRRVYLGGVVHQDVLLGLILDALEERGLADDTLVVVTSDHGEHFGRHGLLGHGQELTEDLLAVPLVAAGPGLPVGRVENDPVSLVDLAPSLRSWAGLAPAPADPGCRGRALLKEGAEDDGTDGAGANGEPNAVAERVRLVERWPMFVEDIAEHHARLARAGREGDDRWAWARAGVVQGGRLVVRVDDPESAGGRVWADRWNPSAMTMTAPDTDSAASLDPREVQALLDALRGGWSVARPSPVGEAEEVDVEALQALGYLGR